MDEQRAGDLFASLVAKQAARELHNLKDQKPSAAGTTLIGKLLSDIKARGDTLTELDLAKYQTLGIPIEAALITGFVHGVAMPCLDLAEANTEPLGQLGVCLMVDSQLFAFHDHADGVVYLPGDHKVKELAMEGTRFLVILGQCLRELAQWDGAHTDKIDGKIAVECEDFWYGKPAESALGELVRYMFAKRKVIFDDEKKLESVKFEREMRKAMGI